MASCTLLTSQNHYIQGSRSSFSLSEWNTCLSKLEAVRDDICFHFTRYWPNGAWLGSVIVFPRFHICMSTVTDKQSGYQTSPLICAQALKDEYVGHVSIFWGSSGDDMRAPLIHWELRGWGCSALALFQHSKFGNFIEKRESVPPHKCTMDISNQIWSCEPERLCLTLLRSRGSQSLVSIDCYITVSLCIWLILLL